MRASWYKAMQTLSASLLLLLLIIQSFSGFVMTGRLGGLDPGDAYFWHTRTILFPFLLMTVIHIISSLRLVALRWQWVPRSGWVDALFLTSGGLLLLGVILLI